VTDLKSKACAPLMLSAAQILKRPLRLALTSLPEDLILRIIRKMEVQDVLSMCGTSKYLNGLASSDAVWTELYNRSFGNGTDLY